MTEKNLYWISVLSFHFKNTLAILNINSYVVSPQLTKCINTTWEKDQILKCNNIARLILKKGTFLWSLKNLT